MNFPVSFSLKNIGPIGRVFFSFTRFIRLVVVVIIFSVFLLVALDVFIFYRYSYRVVNLNPEPVAQSVMINRKELREALEILDVRAEKFKELYGAGTTTSR